MKRWLFIPPELNFGIVVLTILAFYYLTFSQLVVFTFFLILVLFNFRRTQVQFQETLKTDGEIFLSPVSGRVESIRLNVPIMDDSEIGHEVRISISMMNKKGLYLPTSGEVFYLKATKGRKILKDAEDQEYYGSLEEVAHTDLTLSSKNGSKTLMRFVDCPYAVRPTIWLKSGDRGRGGACFGYYPFGGSLLIYLPQHSDVLVFNSERVRPGETVIAALKEVK